MADDLLTNLRTAGEMLDRRGAEAMGTAPADGDHTPVYGLTPLPSSTRRRPPVWLGAAAAALVLLAGVVAVASWNRRDATNVASSPTIAALVPSDLASWDTVEVIGTQSATDRYLDEVDMATYLPSGAGADRERSVIVTYLPWGQGEDELGDAEIVSGAGLRGALYEMPDRRQLFVLDLEVDGESVGLTLTSGPAVSVDELFEFAAAVVVGEPLGRQDVPGWELKGTMGDQRGTGPQEVFLSRATPVTYDSSWLLVSTLTGVSDEAIWTLGEPFRAVETEVRGGKVAWVVVDETGASALWVEAPGVIVRVLLGMSNPEGSNLYDDLLATVEALVPLDLAGWRAFADQHRTEEPEGGVGMTTTTWEAAEFPRRAGASEEMGGPLPDGGTYQLWVVGDTGQTCWALFGRTEGEGCDDDPDLWLDGSRASEPRVVLGGLGEPTLVHGLLPDGATWVDASFQWSGRIESSGAATAGPLWAIGVPAGARTATVRFVDADGSEIYRVDLELATGE